MVSTIFYVEGSSPDDIEKNRKELVGLLNAVMKREGAEVVQAIVSRIVATQKLPAGSRTIKTMEDVTEVMSMWEDNVKAFERRVYSKGREEGREEGTIHSCQETLIDLLAIKFGKSETAERKIRSVKNPAKLEAAIRKVLSATSRQMVIKTLE